MPKTPSLSPRNGMNARDLAMAEKVQILKRQHNEAAHLFAKFKISGEQDYYDLFGANPKQIKRFIEDHYINGSMMALELTGSLPIALAYLYHGIEGNKKTSQISIVGGPDGNETEQVRKILDNYQEVKILTDYYTSQEIVENLHNVLANQTQFLLRTVDEWNRLKLAIDYNGKMNISAMELAGKLSNAYLPIAHVLGFHMLDVRARDTAFSVINPKMYEVIYKTVYGDSSDRAPGKHLNAIRRGVEKILADFIVQSGFSAEVQTRVKSVYGLYKKLTEKHGIGDKYIEGFVHELIPRTHDLVAARVILTEKDNAEEAVYRFHRAFRNAPFFRYATPEQLIKPTDKVHKDYIKKPYADRLAYASIHDILALEEIESFYKSNYGKKISEFGDNSMARLLEVQLRSQDMDDVANYGVGPENHGFMKYSKIMPSLGTTIAYLQKEQESKMIESKIRINIMGTTGVAGNGRENNDSTQNHEYEKTEFNMDILRGKISAALLIKFRNSSIGKVPLEKKHMDRIYGSDKSAIDVYAHHNRMTGEVIIEKITVTKR